MGHRALVAYERPDETYNLHYTHWGGCNLRLKHTITAETPFAAINAEYSELYRVYEQLQSATTPEIPDVPEVKQTETDVRVEPRTVDITLDEAITEHLDYHMHEAFYMVSQEFDVTAYRTFWLGFSSDAQSVDNSATVGNGVLSTVRWYDGDPVGDGYLRGWFTAAKQILGDLIDREFFTESQATTYLVENLLAQTDDGADTYIQRADQRQDEK